MVDMLGRRGLILDGARIVVTLPPDAPVIAATAGFVTGADARGNALTLRSELRSLAAHVSARVRDQLEVHLRYEPTKGSKSRIKRLRGLSRPQFRLRIDDIRVFYDVTNEAVEVLTIISKAQAAERLQERGEQEPGGSPGEG